MVLAYDASYQQVEMVVEKPGNFSAGCFIDFAENVRYCVFIRSDFKRVYVSRKYNINFPLRRTSKHDDTTLALQGKIFVQDLTIFMDVKANPGPNQLDN